MTLRNVRGVEERTLTFAPQGVAGGVVIVEGSNEAGKSTLGDALDVLLSYKESSKAAEVRSLKTVDRDEAPEVEAELEVGDHRFVYAKRFLKRTSTELALSAPRAETVQGDEAHARVERILAEHLDVGLWSSLRLRQADGLRQARPGGTSGLAAALAGHGDASAIGERELAILEQVRAEHERYYTARAGTATGELRDAQQRVDRLADELATLDERRRALQDDVDEADRLARELPGLADQAEEAERRATELERRRAAVEQLRGRVAARERDLEQATERRDRHAERRAGRTALIADLEAAEADRVALADERADAEAATERTRQRLEEARERHRAADERLRQARAGREAAQRDLDLLADRATLAGLRARAVRAADALARRHAAEDELARIAVDEELLDELRAADTEVTRAGAALDAASPELRVAAHRDLAVEADGRDEQLAAGDTRDWPVRGRLRLRLGDVADVEVAAGAGTDEAREEHRRATARRDELLARARAADLGAAEAALRRRTALQSEVEVAARDRDAALDGAGADELDEQIEALQRRIGILEEQREAQAPLPADVEAARDALERATAAEKEAADAVAGPADEVEQARLEHESRRDRHVEQRTRAQGAARDAEQLRATLDEAREATGDEELDRLLADAEQAVAEAEGALAAARSELAGAEPDRITSLADNATAAAGDARARHDEAQQRLGELRAAIAARGGDGLHEQREDVATALGHAETALAGLQRRADAARTLLTVLERHRDAARERYAAPLREQIVRYGSVLHGPGFDVELDDDLRVARRHLDGTWLELDQLSVGAQEQLALLGRLACATLLGDAGGLLLLDDALGNTDPERLELLGAVLREAGEHGQVVVLTCYPDRYRHVGGAIRIRL